MIFTDKTMVTTILIIIINSMIIVNVDSPTANQVCLLPLSPPSSFSSPWEYIWWEYIQYFSILDIQCFLLFLHLENMFVRIFFWEYIFVHWNFCANLNYIVLTSSTKSICFCADMRSGLLLILKYNHSFKNMCTRGWGVDILLLISSASAWSNLLERKCYELGKYTKLWKIAKPSKNGQRCYSCLFLAEKTGAACFVKRGVLCGRWINRDIFISIPIMIS